MKGRRRRRDLGPWAALAGLPLLLVGLAAGAASQPSALALEFSVPAQATGNLTSEATWALLILGPASSADLRLAAAGPSSAVNHTRIDLRAEGVPHSWLPQNRSDEAVAVRDDLQAGLRAEGSWSSVLVEAGSIELTASAARATLRASDGDDDPNAFVAAEEGGSAPVLRSDGPLATGAALTLQAGTLHEEIPFHLAVRGLRRVEWHNVTVACTPSTSASEASGCPDGARPFGASVPLPGGFAESRVMPFLDLRPANGTLDGEGTALSMVVLGQGMDLAVHGRARFPQAVLSGDCGGSACPDPAGRTFQAEGDLLLRGLAPAPSKDRMRTDLQGAVGQARFDEQPIPELVGQAAWVGAAAVGLAVLARVAWALFARNPRPVLEHPRSKALNDLIHEVPGLSFTQVKERTGWGHGTTRYHLQRLLRAGQVVAYGYQNSVRYFENHERHKDDWMEHAALHKPELRALHQWIAEHPRSSQSQVIAATAKWGWKRSVTQKRLRRLVEAALVEDHRTPAAVEYVARPPRRGVHIWPGLSPA